MRPGLAAGEAGCGRGWVRVKDIWVLAPLEEFLLEAPLEKPLEGSALVSLLLLEEALALLLLHWVWE